MEAIKKWMGLETQDSVIKFQDLDINEDTSSSKPTLVVEKNHSTIKGGNSLVSIKKPGVLFEVPNVKTPVKKPDDLAEVSEVLSQEDVLTSPTKDCKLCKAIGVSTLTSCAFFLMYNGHYNRNNYIGMKRVAFMGQYIFLSTTLALMAVSVAFDLGFFQERRKDETVFDLAKKEARYFKEKLSLFTSSIPPK